MLTPEQKSKLQAAGYTPEKIAAFESYKKSDSAQPAKEKGFLDKVGEKYIGRAENVISDIKRPAELMSKGASPLKVAGAVGEAGLRTVGNVIGAAFDPIATAIEPVAAPVVEKIAQIPGIKQGVNAATEWASKHPEAAKDFGALFEIATLPAAGAATTAAKSAAKTGVKAAAETVAPVGRTLKAAGEAAYGVTVPMKEATSKSLLNYQAKQGSLLNRVRNMAGGALEGKPITEANTAARLGLVGTERELGIQAKQFSDKIWESKIAPKLEATKEAVDMRQFITELEDDIVKNTPELGRRNSLLEALEAFKSDYKNVGKIGGSKLQEYKEGWAKFIPEATYAGKPIAGALKEVRNMAASKARRKIYEIVGEEGKEAYIDWGNLQSIITSGVKSTTGDAAKRSLGRNVWEFIMDKAVTPIATVSGKVLYKTGDGLEFIGDLGAKKVKDVVK